MNFSKELIKQLKATSLNSSNLSYKTLRITTYTSDDKPISNATGFVVEQDGKCNLYTCWHVVSGIDFLNPVLPVGGHKPNYLKIQGVDVNLEQNKNHRGVIFSPLGNVYVGGTYEKRIELYDGTQRWIQDERELRECEITKATGIHVPKLLDVVKIPLDISEKYSAVWSIQAPKQIYYSITQNFDDLYISGFPYGYTAQSNSPIPIVLKRSIASMMTDNLRDIYLDGGGSPSMSGAPVWDKSFKLIGIYRGVMYPDFKPNSKSNKPNDKHSALGLMTPFFTFHNVI